VTKCKGTSFYTWQYIQFLQAVKGTRRQRNFIDVSHTRHVGRRYTNCKINKGFYLIQVKRAVQHLFICTFPKVNLKRAFLGTLSYLHDSSPILVPSCGSDRPDFLQPSHIKDILPSAQPLKLHVNQSVTLKIRQYVRPKHWKDQLLQGAETHKKINNRMH
jgi:hypothetical protein